MTYLSDRNGWDMMPTDAGEAQYQEHLARVKPKEVGPEPVNFEIIPPRNAGAMWKD